MLRRTNRVWVIVAMAVLFAAGTMLVNAAAQKASVPKPQNRLTMGEDEVRRLLLLLDPNKKGMISKQEFIKFMEAEFDRLDKNKQGELSVKELIQPTLTVSRYVGK